MSVDGIPTEMLKLLSRRTGTGVFVFEDGVFKNLKLFSMIPIKTRKKYTMESEKNPSSQQQRGVELMDGERGGGMVFMPSCKEKTIYTL